MRETTKATYNFTKKDIVNSISGLPLQELDCPVTLEIESCCLKTEIDLETGEPKPSASFKTIDGVYYSSISTNVYDAAFDLIDFIDDEKKAITVRIDKRKAKKSEREFLTMTIL